MIYLILVLSLLLRGVSLNQSLWWDEAINVVSAKNLNFLDFLIKYPIGDFHPPGFFTILWVWVRIFGSSEIAVRVPSVILGVCTVYLTYLLGKKLFSNEIGLLASLFLAVSPLHIYYSQEARMYSLSAFAVCLSFYFYTKLLKKEKFSSIGYTLSLFLVLSSDYMAYLAIPVQILYALFYKKEFKRTFLANASATVLFSPWLFVFKNQLKQGLMASKLLPGWSAVVGGLSLKNVALTIVKPFIGHISIDNKIIYGSLGLVIILSLIIFSFKVLKRNFSLLIFGWLIIPTILALVISMFIPVFSYFRLIFLLPALNLFIVFAIEQYKEKYRVPLILFFLAVLSLSSLIYLTNPRFQREDWRSAIKATLPLNSEQIVFEDNNVPLVFHYYNPSSNQAFPGLNKIPATSLMDIKDIPSNIKKVYLYDYLVEINDPSREVARNLNKLGFKITRTLNFNGVGFVYIYEKK